MKEPFFSYDYANAKDFYFGYAVRHFFYNFS